jgi:hypothetical protein
LGRLICQGRAYLGDRLTPELHALNRSSPRLPGLHVRFDATGRWWITTDNTATSGRGAVDLVATLAAVPVALAAQFLAHLLPAEAAP